MKSFRERKEVTHLRIVNVRDSCIFTNCYSSHFYKLLFIFIYIRNDIDRKVRIFYVNLSLAMLQIK